MEKEVGDGLAPGTVLPVNQGAASAGSAPVTTVQQSGVVMMSALQKEGMTAHEVEPLTRTSATPAGRQDERALIAKAKAMDIADDEGNLPEGRWRGGRRVDAAGGRELGRRHWHPHR